MAFSFRNSTRELAAGLPRQDHVYKSTDESIRFRTKISMECIVNCISLRIRVLSRNTQPHLKSGSSSRPYASCKISKGWPPRDAPSKLVQLWCKTFLTDQCGLLEMKNPTGFQYRMILCGGSDCGELNLRNIILSICTER